MKFKLHHYPLGPFDGLFMQLPATVPILLVRTIWPYHIIFDNCNSWAWKYRRSYSWMMTQGVGHRVSWGLFQLQTELFHQERGFPSRFKEPVENESLDQ